MQLATYQEWQERDGEPYGRLSSAIFRECPEAPQQVQWLHLHELSLREHASG